MHYFTFGTPLSMVGIREKTAENKGFDVGRYNKINITFPERIIVENIIPRNQLHLG